MHQHPKHNDRKFSKWSDHQNLILIYLYMHFTHPYLLDLQTLNKPLKLTHPLIVLGSCNNHPFISNIVEDITL